MYNMIEHKKSITHRVPVRGSSLRRLSLDSAPDTLISLHSLSFTTLSSERIARAVSFQLLRLLDTATPFLNTQSASTKNIVSELSAKISEVSSSIKVSLHMQSNNLHYGWNYQSALSYTSYDLRVIASNRSKAN